MNMFTMLVLIILALTGASFGKIEMHPDCEGQTYCDHKPDNYDNYGADMDNYIHTSKYWAGISAKNTLEDLQPRIMLDPDNCGYVEEIHKPYTIQVNGTKLVVQSKYLEQRIKITKCLDKQQSCFDQQKAQQDNIDTECDESYTTITLFIYEDGSIQPQKFNIPVCCTCKVHFKDPKK